MKLNPRLTAEGVVLVKRGERLRPRAEARPGGGWVVGYGHTASAREGAVVSEADADTLLVYDLSQSADRVAALLHAPVDAPRFDALNAAAFRMGPEAFARSEVLRRVNSGEALGPEEILRGAEPSSPAVIAAADAVRARLDRVLQEPSAPEAAPTDPFPPPEPRALPRATPSVTGPAQRLSTEAEPPPFLPEPTSAPERRDDDAKPQPPAAPAKVAKSLGDAAPADAATPSSGVAGPASSRAFDPEATRKLSPFDHPDGSEWAPPADEPARRAAALRDAPVRAPVVTFERGGRASLWRRIKEDPRVYAALGACGVALFVCALIGFALGRPTGMGLAVGLTGVLCLAVSAAFFLYRWLGRDLPSAPRA